MENKFSIGEVNKLVIKNKHTGEEITMDYSKTNKIDELDEKDKEIKLLTYQRDKYKDELEMMTEEYHRVLDILNKDKQIELGKTYFVTEWSYSPLYDGRLVFEEIIREHAAIDGIDCYFTNANNRVYFKEDIYTNIEEANKACSWQNSFTYDYDCLISRQNKVMKLIDFERYHWKYKDQ